ncbi:hypothetical protein F5148DRAFT_114060 [Russula earlei]|uniref:Uncharacterized protein n=1 Tax=Russula earlei TaxID=71964 RepID=A0ACC0U6Y8_9AGAM|nr:hypothetical protein F5148DRAFT_114060 [Russula earlei]
MQDSALSYVNAECGDSQGPGLLSTHRPDLPGGHSETFNSGGSYAAVHPSATLLWPSFDTSPRSASHEHTTPVHTHQQESAHAISQQILSFDHISPSTVMTSGDPVRNHDTGVHPGLRDPQVECRSTSIQPELFMDLSTCYNTGSPRNRSKPDAFRATSIRHINAPEGRRHENQLKVRVSKRRAHDANRRCPVCLALLGRFQDRERHVLSHLPHSLYCQDPGCS